MVTYGDLPMKIGDLLWFMMIYQWKYVIYGDLWWFTNENRWFMVIYGDLPMKIGDLWWFMVIYPWLAV